MSSKFICLAYIPLLGLLYNLLAISFNINTPLLYPCDLSNIKLDVVSSLTISILPSSYFLKTFHLKFSCGISLFFLPGVSSAPVY